MYNKQIFAVLASASAIKLDSEGSFKDFMEKVLYTTADAGNAVYDLGIVPLNNFADSTVALGEYLFSLDGLASDTEYIFTKDFGNDLLDAGQYVFDGDYLLKDTWTWMTENQGQNWVAFGKNTLNTGYDLIKLDFEGAWNRFFDSENYYFEDDSIDMDSYAAYYQYLTYYNEKVQPNID